MSISLAGDETMTVAGYYQGDNVNFGASTHAGGPNDGYASFVLNLDANGAFVSERVFNEGLQCQVVRMARDPLDDQLYVGGLFTGTQDFGGGPVTQMDGSVLLGLNRSLGWQFNRSLLHANIQGMAILPDGFGVVVGGSYFQTTDFGGPSRVFLGSGPDGFLAKYTPQGTYGGDRVLSADAYISLAQVAVDSDGNILASGDFDQPFSFGGGLRDPEGLPAAFLVKYDQSLGTWLWDATFPAGSSSYGLGVACTPGNDVILGGMFSGTMDIDPGPGIWQLSAAISSYDVWIQRLRGDIGRL